jgi:histidyl-tRNA synthetase
MKDMNKDNLQPLKGFRDSLPKEALKRKWLRARLSEICESWGFDPMETPTLEPLELFEGQIGEDEKLFFKFKDNAGRDVALRYDQTVPTCRVVAQNSQQLPMPFRRYQIQSAFRAENPQKGRYREFTQCDADIFGIPGPSADAEVIALSLDIYRKLGFKEATVLVNDRSLLKDIPYKAIVAIDKLDKIGKDGVISEMVAKGIPESEAISYLTTIQSLKPNETIQLIFSYLKNQGFDESWYKFEPTLARSFSYSTGPIWEVKIPGLSMGSVLGGERFDNLVTKISGANIPATGFGLGFDRTLEACDLLNLIPNLNTSTDLLVTIFKPEYQSYSQELSNSLRSQGINTELYPDPNAKLEKQFKYADKKGIKWLIVRGPDEVKNDTVVLKNMETGKQEETKLESISNIILTSS